jgi:hypothetical protein
MNFLKAKFDEFERKIAKLKSLEKELDSLDTEGFESEIRVIRSKLKSPNKIPEIENEIEELKVKIGRRIPEISVNRTTSEISIKEGQELEVKIELKNVGEDTARSVSLSDRINNDLKIISGENSWTGDLKNNEAKLLRYKVKADKAGKYSIPTLVVDYKDKRGRKYEKSASIVEIEVTPQTGQIPEKIFIKPKLIIEPSPKNAYGVVIGINKYEDNDIPSLKYAKNDAIEIYNILTDPNYGKFSDKNVKLLLDEQATLQKIRSAMGTFLARNAQKDDIVYIYFAGHGSPELDPAGKADDNFEKYIVPYDAKKYDLFSSGLSMEEIKKIFQRIESNRVIFFIDSCYSGEAGGRTFSRPGFQTKDLAMSDRFLEELSAEGRIIFAASKPDELSLEIDEFQHGLFTYYLAEGLKGKADIDDDGIVTIDELINYVSDNVPRKAQQLGGRQHPLRKGESAGKIPLTFCETEKKRQIKELNSEAAELFEKGEYETAIEKWNDVIKKENDNSKALNGIKEAKKRIEEKTAILRKKQSALIRLHEKGLPTKEFDEAMTLLKKDTSIYNEKEKKICKYIEDMLNGKICIETYLDTRIIIENNENNIDS